MFSGRIDAAKWKGDETVNGRRLMRKSLDCCQRFGGESRMLIGTIGSCDGSLLRCVYRGKAHDSEALHLLMKLISF